VRNDQQRALIRGQVFLTQFQFAKRKLRSPDDYGYKDHEPKYVIVLRGDPADETDVPVLIANSVKTQRPHEEWEAYLDPDPNRFRLPTYVDCRSPYTLMKWQIGDDLKFQLTTKQMERIDLKLIIGLQMQPLTDQ